MYAEIDLSLKTKNNIKLYLCKPNRQIIGKLNEAFNIAYTTKLGSMNQLSFSLPYEITVNHELVKNPNIDILRERYLVKLVDGYHTEWFIIKNPKDTMGESEDFKSITCMSLEYELNDKILKNYNVESYNCTRVTNDALRDTIWNLGYVDSQFDLTYRAFDVSTMTVLDFIYRIAETFNALLIFDTQRREIHFYQHDHIGKNKGYKVSYGKYLKSLDLEVNSDDICTRLRVFGKDNLSIQRLNPTGANYLEDFSYFMYPFQRDQNKNVINHSYYMSDDLCNAILDYKKLLDEKKGDFATLLDQKNEQQTILTNYGNELEILNTELMLIEDNLDIAQSTGSPAGDLLRQRNEKLTQIENKINQINSVKSQISAIDTQVSALQSEISIENNFTSEQILERNMFIVEREWSDSNYFDDEILYKDALKRFEELKNPQIVVKIDTVNVKDVITESHNWDKLNLGDAITVVYERIGVKIKAKIIEIEFNYEEGNINLTISNAIRLETDEEKFQRILQKSVSTSTSVDMSKYKWNDAVATVDDVSQILENVWRTAERAINSGVNESVTIDRRGITISDPRNPLKFVRMTHGVIGITNDGGNTYKQVMDGTGIYAERLIGRIIMGNNLIISDDRGNFTIEGNLLTIKDNQQRIRTLLGEYDPGKFGLKLLNKDGNSVVLDEDGILQTWQEGRADNVDSNNGLVLHIFIPTNTISIREARLRFKMLNFRSYSTGAASSVSSAQTTNNATVTVDTFENTGGTDFWTSSGQYMLLPGFTGDSTGTENLGTRSLSMAQGGSHNHGIPHNTSLRTTSGGSVLFQQYSGFTPSGNVILGSHSHATYHHGHRVTIPHHRHAVTLRGHSHSVNIPSHTHALVHGIYTSTIPLNVTVKINSIDRTNVLGGSFNSDQNNLNITAYLVAGQWNSIELGSSRLGRLDANVFIQTFMGV